MENQTKVTDELIKLLQGGSAHASLADALEGLTQKVIGEKVDKLPYTIWQLTEHIRIVQWDMLEFCKSKDHKSPMWPKEYWPKETHPADKDAWEKTIEQIKDDLDEFIELVRGCDLNKPIPWGDGQTLLREALQMADHNSYHTAEIIVIRRLLDAWK